MTNLIRTFVWLLPFTGFLAGYFIPILILPSTQQKTPHVIGKPLHEALTILAEHNLNARLIKEQEDAIIPPGTILHQNPSPLQPIKHNQTITLIASKRVPLPKTPDLIQKNPSEVPACLKVVQAQIDYIAIPSAHKASYCLAQYPGALQPLTSKRIAAYISSNKKTWYCMPSFINQPLSWVHEYLSSISLSYESFIGATPITHEQVNSHAFVTAQKPAAGSIINLLDPPRIQFYVQE